MPGRQQVAGDRKTLTRINRLITEATRDPGAGTGKPERLSGDLTGFWSRRIDQEGRLVYTVKDDLIVVQARYHYWPRQQADRSLNRSTPSVAVAACHRSGHWPAHSGW